MKASTALLLASSLVSPTIASLLGKRAAATISNPNTPPVTVKGNAFFANNQRFYIRGVDYQPGGSSLLADPIADAAGCQRDVQYFQQLGINTVRVYTVDNSANHDACMKSLADAGIYLALDVNTPAYSLNRADNASCERSYNDVYLQFIFSTIDAFAQYDNTLLFFSGNEVINDNATSFAAPYVKAVTRDMKAYINARGYRAVPVGYSAADVEDNRYQMATYMNCGSDNVRSDFFAFNDYSWCDPSSFTVSGWDKKVQQFSSYSIPLFLSEFGCNTNTRDFGEVAALYSANMTAVYSGGLVYEYSQEANNYGLVAINSTGVSPLPDFDALQSQLKNNPIPTGDGGYSANGSPSQCPSAQPPAWVVSGTDLPAMPANAQKYLQQGAGPGVGLGDTTGSQNAGTASSGTVSGTSGSSGSSSSKKSAGTYLQPSVSFALAIALGTYVFASSL